MKHTAVDWLINQIELEAKLAFLDNSLPQWLINKAKEMEKEQIERAYHQGVVNEISIYSTPDAEQYYKQTYEE